MCVCYQAEISLTWKDGLCITPSSDMADEKTSDSERPTQIGIDYQVADIIEPFTLMVPK